MYLALSILAGLLGLAVTACVVFTAYVYYTERKKTGGGDTSIPAKLLRWTAIDYAVLFLFLTGTVFLLVELVAVTRDRESYPFYHYGYLLSGIMYSVLSMVFLVVRMTMLLRAAAPSNDPAAALVPQHNEPKQADAAE
ncbi:hypothetical protein [Paenibacillus turpanensis]|uniref:hypothetical protein n=1 Tax=Paenibacillus turpanensis TaxID=2689078 RepID=UPI0014097BF3|nr:hypothetical protein [Paenibacillus turpanensis]